MSLPSDRIYQTIVFDFQVSTSPLKKDSNGFYNIQVIRLKLEATSTTLPITVGLSVMGCFETGN